jgi:RIO-like serine/threonine protein kinase
MSFYAINKKSESRDVKTGFEPYIPQARNTTKAEVRLEHRNGKKVIVKDYSRRSLLIRFFYGRFTLRREAKAYARLAGVAGIPRCFGFEGKYALLFEYIPSRPLSQFRSGEVPESVFDKLDQMISSMHSRGVANTDLHRSNILLTEAGDVYMVDFVHSLTDNNPKFPGPLTRLSMQLDLHAAAKIRARYLGQKKPEPIGFFGVLYRIGRSLKFLRKKIKLINR